MLESSPQFQATGCPDCLELQVLQFAPLPLDFKTPTLAVIYGACSPETSTKSKGANRGIGLRDYAQVWIGTDMNIDIDVDIDLSACMDIDIDRGSDRFREIRYVPWMGSSIHIE